LKFLLTIFCTLCLLQTFGQQNDSLLQRLIEDAKIKQQTNKPVVAAKDTAQKIVKPPVVKKDSTDLNAKTNALDSPVTVGQAPAADTSADTLNVPVQLDSAALAVPVPVLVKQPMSWLQDTAFQHLLNLAPGSKKIISVIKDGDLHLPQQKDFLFYLLVGVVLLLAIIKQSFPKYFQNLFRILFQASFRQKQTREQLMQETLPSLLMNILFIIVGGLFIALLADNYKWLHTPFWLLAVYSTTILALVYMFKYLVIQFTGWAFQVKEQASTYGFIVFLVNKVIGLALLPLLLLVAFSAGQILEISITAAACLVVLLLLFRYIVSLTIIRGTLSIHPIHFFIYLCAVELVPMLIIYKVMFSYIGKSNL